jgi:Na+/H+ antiporter NhaD/arsenite permease-like protein
VGFLGCVLDAMVVLRAYGTDVSLGEFTRLAVLTVIPALALSVLALWLSLWVLGG